MRVSSILIIASALALPIAAQGGHSGGGSKSSGTTAKTPAAPTPSVNKSGGDKSSGTLKAQDAPDPKPTPPSTTKIEGVGGESQDDKKKGQIE
jgi:hypothetical protein